MDREETGIVPQQVQLLGKYVGQLAGMLMALEKEVEAMKRDNARRITVNHQQALALNGLIRARATEYCEKYGLDPAVHGAAVKRAIKKDILKMNDIRDLHDLPLGELDSVKVRICGWSSFALAARLRKTGGESHGGAGQREA